MQDAGLGILLADAQAPYVDLAIRGANNNRILKKVKLRGMVLDASGSLRLVEQLGPATFEMWEEG